jgi:hypothetical protein
MKHMKHLFFFMTVLLLWAGSALAIQFNHAEHLIYLEGEPCFTCHVAGARSIVPERSICMECHDPDMVSEVKFSSLRTHDVTWSLNHRAFAKNKSIDCATCHQQSECLECHKAGFADEMGDFGNHMLNVHRSDFHVTHPILARSNPQLCSSCHETSFCSDCHARFAPQDLASPSHRKGFTLGTLGGAHALFDETQCQTCHVNSVLPTHEWSSQHAREARRGLATCQTCHPQGDVCLKCHSARTGLMINPHPKGWDDMKGRLDRASGGRTCRQCH